MNRSCNGIIKVLDVKLLVPLLIRICQYPSAFADDNYTLKVNKDLVALKQSLEITMRNISKWLKNSGLKVNDEKTEICIFSRTDVASIVMDINWEKVTTKKEMNVLGITFDSKLQ